MSVSLSCKGCKTTLKVPDQFAGKKVKCPKCNAVVTVPEEEEIVAVEVKEQRVKAGPARKGSPSHYDEDDGDSARRRRVKTSRDRDDDDDRRSRYREEDDDDRRRRRRRDDDEPLSPFKPCPRCGAEKSRRVMWTAWGSFYGPSLFNHVRCPKCGTTYNGKTGRSNTLAAIVFVSIPLLGIGAIIGAILFMLMRRGHL
jgi:LSD1 subclass zinc finger protein